MEFVTCILGCIGPCMLDSIKSRYGYLKHYHDNIAKLEGQVQILEARETDVLNAKKDTEGNGEEILESVQRWITDVDRVKEEARVFLDGNKNTNKRCFKGCFPDVCALYRLSRDAESKHQAIETLYGELAKFGSKFSQPAPLRWIDSITSEEFSLFQTTKLAMEKVMDALKEDSTDLVGIYGMGGVGKTTLVKQIARKSKEEGLFDNIVKAVVSQTVDIASIQNQIADLLGQKLEGKTETARQSLLFNLLKSKNKILVILDDLWAWLNLAEIGIPSGKDHKGCKVVITTRRKQVCTTMGVQVDVSLDVLTTEESWNLFKLQATDDIGSPPMRSVAEKVCNECGGLPIALVTLGKAMRGKDPDEWEEAAQELEKAMPVNIEDMDENVFKVIKLSYDYLGKELKDFFLLCGLFPEDYEIDVESLVRHGVGLNIFEGIDNIEGARKRAHSTIKNLKASSLLVAVKDDDDGEEIKDLVKMHDVVRDVARGIASNRYVVKAGMHLKEWPARDGYNGVAGISLMGNDIRQYPDALECPDLDILLMQNNHVERQVPEEVFKGMKKLRVLDQSSEKRENRRLEPSFSHLTSLQTLIIDGYSQLTNASIWGIGALGELKMLQVISLRWWRFEEPLDALRKMKNLRLLDLAFSENCSSLFNLAEDCNFPKLEELYLTEPGSHSVVEVMKCCPRLNALWFHMDDTVRHLTTLTPPHYFKISTGPYFTTVGRLAYVAEVFKNTLCLMGGNGGLDAVALPNKIGRLLARVSIMRLRDLNGLRNIVPYLVVDKDSLKELEVISCVELEYLINIEERGNILQPTCFSSLERLELRYLRSFRGLCGMLIVSDIPYAFSKLRTLFIGPCPKMSNIGAPLNLLRRMQQLETLFIMDCEALEDLFDLKEEVEDAVEEEEEGILANLKDLTLISLSNLKELWKGNIGLLHLRNLKTVDIFFCDKLKVLFHWSVAQRLEQLQQLKVDFCYELEEIVGRQTGEETVHNGPGFVPFRNLKTVRIKGCHKLKVAFHWSVAQRLEQLQDLAVWDCDELEAIVGSQTGEEIVHDEVLFPELRKLCLYGLRKLNDFYTGNLPGRQTTPKLKTVRMGKYRRTAVEIAVDGMNLDRVIKDHKNF